MPLFSTVIPISFSISSTTSSSSVDCVYKTDLMCSNLSSSFCFTVNCVLSSSICSFNLDISLANCSWPRTYIFLAQLGASVNSLSKLPHQIIELIFHYYKNNQSNVILQRNYLLFRLLYDTGLRISELLNLKVSNIDFNSKTIHVQNTKTRVERYVFFGEETKVIFNKYLVTSKHRNYIFIDFVTGEMLKLDTVHSICRRLRNKLNIEKSIRPHMWRHTFATRYVKLNGNMEVLRLIMGHSSLKTTQKYLHIDKDHLHKEYFRLNT
ncbi:site-specific integrase [Mycoplasmatota bacterium zrk1]